MRREISTTPYEPHRYVDELPDTAWANYHVWRDQVLRGGSGAGVLAYSLDVHVFRVDNRGARIRELLSDEMLFVDLAGGIDDVEDQAARSKAIHAIFGSLAELEVEDLIEAVVMQDGVSNLQSCIVYRVYHGSFNDADLAWIQRQAAELVTDDDFMALDPFQGDESEVTVLARRVVRARREHRCHWTGLPIPAGERHLVLRELCDGDFVTTRHSRVAAWCEVFGGDGSLAEMLKRGEADPIPAAA